MIPAEEVNEEEENGEEEAAAAANKADELLSSPVQGKHIPHVETMPDNYFTSQ